MKKSEWIDAAAKESGMTKKQMTAAYASLEKVLQDAIMRGEEVQISGFGTFVVRNKEVHTGRNPKTNEIIQIPASRQVAFLPGKTLKEKINET
ncbi:MAG: HU family DNA-binding protein [Clostridia bacterium]|nr:HU family DNA-binding protein [Clostridia bacterium]